MAELDAWDIAAANNNSAPPDGFPENMNYSEVNNAAREVMAVLARFWKDTNGELQLAGTANTYTLTLNAGYTAYFQGMYFAAEVNLSNTGATTINVNALGAQSVVNRDGSALSGGELTAGGIYEFRYDGVNFQLMGTLATTSDITFGSVALTDTSSVDLTNSVAPLVISPGTGQHLELDANELQSKSDATTAASVSINRLGGDVNLGAQSGLGSVVLYDDAAIAVQTYTDNNTGIVIGSSSTWRMRPWNASDLDIDGLIGGTAAGALIEGPGSAHVTIGVRGNDATDGFYIIDTNEGGDVDYTNVIFEVRGGAHTGLYHARTERLRTVSTGVDIFGTRIDVDNSGAVTAAEIAARNSEGGVLLQTDGADASLIQTNSAGTVEDTWVSMSQNGAVSLHYNHTARVTTTSDGATVTGLNFRVDNSAAATQVAARVYNSAGGIMLLAEATSGDGEIWQTSGTGSGEDVWVNLVRNGGVTLNFNNSARLQTTTNGVNISGPASIISSAGTTQLKIYSTDNGGVEVSCNAANVNLVQQSTVGGDEDTWVRMNYNGSVILFNDAVEQLQTQDNDAAYTTSGAQVKDHGGTFRDIGYNVMPVVEQDTALTFNEAQVGAIVHKDAGGAITYTLPSGVSGAIPPVGATIMIANEDTETITISAAGTLRWFEGAGTPSTGNRSLDEGGVCTVYHYANTEWWIWGNGLS